ncbi:MULTISPECIES: LPS biosynthesis protein [Methylosinus]|uniref:Lipopolysaccharide biosynthesis protein n=1 Tax=Methylosinus trichosporium (strain ATCC 35070 / NCIMB 11131 / UNIQEM 75 / OB3b) TaxID=595536 RepID=A0A2D2CYJ0_METT3|nr:MULTISPECIES: LPS biosynthesis protein [Methylosinus]ATQ67785.1 lipopolysaccharide biosynthesis protein [Methylosinus trichosporium OB3b]OBS51802.1 lipopolysaccharide biosynthesis protein [Methylosinus sp. 3S-1]
MNDAPKPPELRSQNPMERAEAVSRFLADAARRARFSARVRGAYKDSSFAARRGARALRIAFAVLFVLVVAIPNAMSVAYYGLIASDQYVAEARFTVSGSETPRPNGAGVIELPMMMIMQDTLIITSFLESRALVEQLERQVGLRALYGAPSVDRWARFDASKSIEPLIEYWTKMAEAKMGVPSGIVTLTVRAFSPEDARRIAEAVVSDCDTLINKLNERMREDTVKVSEQEVALAVERLKTAWVELERARNEEGLIDVALASKSQTDVLSGLESELLAAQKEYQIRSHYLEESAPQLRVMRRRIEALEGQVAERRAQMTAQESKGVAALARRTLSGKMTKFASLDLEHKIAEARYQAATAALDAARQMSQRKMLYLQVIEWPATPQESRYPRRLLYIGVIFVGSLALWGALLGLITFVRNNMA